MTTITVPIPDEYLLKLKKMATDLGMSPEELVRTSIDDLLARSEEPFQKATDYVLKKNAELYRRLA